MESLNAPFIIAEVGSNWRRYATPEQNLECARHHIRVAADCHASAVKFQLFTHHELYGTEGPTTYDLPRDWLVHLHRECINRKIDFLCTAFSADGVKAVDPYVKRHKIASAEFNHQGIRTAIADTGKPVIISLGGYDQDEPIIWRGGPLTILECVSAYPADPKDYNLSTLKGWTCDSVGVSDHTLSPAVALTAIGFGATVFEKHFDACPDMAPTPDTPVSISPQELKEYCTLIKEGFSAIGDSIKRPRESEREFLKVRRPAGMNTFRGKL